MKLSSFVEACRMRSILDVANLFVIRIKHLIIIKLPPSKCTSLILQKIIKVKRILIYLISS